jgi:hypothetical protein
MAAGWTIVDEGMVPITSSAPVVRLGTTPLVRRSCGREA